MARLLTFQQITDSRFEEEDKLLDILQKRMESIEVQLMGLPDVIVMRNTPYRLYWPASGNEAAIVQYRVTYYIRKLTRAATWNQVMRIVNAVKPVPYDWINVDK